MRLSHLATGILVIAAVVLTSDRCWAIRQGLGPSKDDWGLKFDVEVIEAEGDKLTVVFKLADDGRLKPIYSVDLVAFSKQTDSQGGRAYDVKEKIELKPTADGQRGGQATMDKRFADRATIRIITLNFDGKRQPSGGMYYDIPVAKFLKKATATKSSPATR